MDSITGVDMAIAMSNAGGMGIYTRHINDEYEEQKQCIAVQRIRESVGVDGVVACAIGVKCDIVKRTELLHKHGSINAICLDIANGNHIFMINAIRSLLPLKDKYGITIIAGNVATPMAAIRLANAGADSIRVGIGPGAACTTRRITGFGVPQFSAILDCANALENKNVTIIADGGIRFPGDAIKGLWAGASAIMMGYVLAGHRECPKISDVPWKAVDIPRRIYRGMSSRNVSRRFDVTAEGVSFDIPEKGKVGDTILEYEGSIKSACTYANAMDLNGLRNNVRAIRVSTMSQQESDPIRGE
jgi:IMP dehydrogenase